LDGIQSLEGLKTLDISNTLISDLSPLANLHGLQNIYASNSNVTSLKPIMELPLSTLYCYGCAIPASEIEEFRSRNPNCYIDQY
jgi:Leucine-rich repeat (LRR) protein